jgi:hypothetical protein
MAVTRTLTTGLRAECARRIGDYLKERLHSTDFDQYLTTKATDDFLKWLDAGIDNFLRDLKRAADDAHRAKIGRIGAHKFWAACEVFAITHLTFVEQRKRTSVKIVFGRKLDKKHADEFSRLVRERHHERSRALHPDRIQAQGRQPTEAERAEYQAVQDARDVLEDYIRTMTVG